MKKVINNIVFFVILICLLFGLGFLLSSKLFVKDDYTDKKSEVSTRLAKEEDNTIDIIILGDSLSYTSVSPMELWKDYGYTSYDFGLVGAKLSEIEDSLNIIKESQSPKLVILETNSLFRSDSKGNEAKNFLTELIYKVFPITRDHDNWKLPFLDKRKGNYKGFTVSYTVDPSENKEYMIPTAEVENVTSENRETVEEISKICSDMGATLVLYSAPSQINYNCKRHNGLKKLADELNVDYIDMNLTNGELTIDWSTDTRDAGDHVNVYGAIKTTAYLGKYLYEHYNIPDRRNESIASAWNDMLDKYVTEASPYQD